jgi:glucose-1-phosphate adenylyltransferase
MRDVLTLVLGGGRGARLFPLTRERSEPAVPLAGKYRLIDVPISNCLNSGLNRIYVLTQFQSVSLHRHIARTYKGGPFEAGFVEVLAAQQTNEAADWYQGTADALRQNARYVFADGCRDVLVLCGDQLYRMDFARMLDTHRRTGADATLAVLPVARQQAGRLGVLHVDDGGRLVRFREKPQTDDELRQLRTSEAELARFGLADRGREFLANMGIYLFTREAFFDLLHAHPQGVDVVRDLLIPSLGTHRVQAHFFDGYWEDLGSIGSYHAAHLALAGDDPPFDFYSPEGVIFTRMRHLPASHVLASQVSRCLISDGCHVGAGARLERCVVGIRSRIGADVQLRETVMLGADGLETNADRAANRGRGVPDLGVGAGSVIQRAILDKDCRVGRGVRIVNERGLANADGENYYIRDGVVVVPNSAVVADGTVI